MEDVPVADAASPERARIAELEAALAEAQGTIARLRRAYERALEQLKLLQHRLFVAKAERVDTSAAQLAFDVMLAEADRLAKELAVADAGAHAATDEASAKGDGGAEANGTSNPRKPRGQGRRNFDESKIPEVRVEVTDPEWEGKAERIGVEESSKLGYQRGGARRIIVERVVYKEEGASDRSTNGTEAPIEPGSVEQGRADALDTGDGVEAMNVTRAEDAPVESAKAGERNSAEGENPASSGGATRVRFITAPLPKEIVRRGLLAPSMIAHILTMKYLLGVPFYRLEQQLALQGAPLDRGTMCRYAEEVGAALGFIVEAMRKDAFETALCLSTDATGICIQPGPMSERKEQKRAPCRKGHFFVVLADRDHVFFEYQPKHTSAAVCEMFRGFSRYIQADAHAIYDALFRGVAPKRAPGLTPSGPPPIEVGCWSHARTNFWEGTVCKHPVALEGLRRIDLIFAADRLLAKLPPATKKERRDRIVRPLVDGFFAWAKQEHARVRERGLVSTALGYALNQEEPLRRFLEDGHLRLENNPSERALRAIAAARKVFMFFGSDDHASAAANLFSLIASCKLHRLDPEAYLTDVVRALPYWPRDRYLELAPRYWARTRARLDAAEMDRPLGHVTVPPPLPAEEQHATA